VVHRGRFYDTDLCFEQDVFAVSPAQPEMKPSMVYVFELFMLGSKAKGHTDQVVGWGVVPVCGPSFEGKRHSTYTIKHSNYTIIHTSKWCAARCDNTL
jgi:hypothetical protein